jgi:hypothetical protein
MTKTNLIRFVVCVFIIVTVGGLYYSFIIEQSYGSPGNLVSYESMIADYGVTANLTGNAKQVEAQQVFAIVKNLNTEPPEQRKPKTYGINQKILDLKRVIVESHQQGIVSICLHTENSLSMGVSMEIHGPEGRTTYTLIKTWLRRWQVTNKSFVQGVVF